jgi:hypothetical protein
LPASLRTSNLQTDAPKKPDAVAGPDTSCGASLYPALGGTVDSELNGSKEESTMRHFSKGIVQGLLLLLFIGGAIVTLSFIVTAQENKVPEPETIGVLFWRDPANNALVPLDRETISVKASPGFFKASAKLRINGVSAKLRLKADPKPEFIVQLANGVDPNKIKLYLLKVDGGKRVTTVATASAFGSKSELKTLPFDVTKYGQSSYKLTPSQPLVPGEYTLNATDSTDAFCFAIDFAK